MNTNNSEKNNFHIIPSGQKLARELAYGLNDMGALPLYTSFVRKYPEKLLLEIFIKVLAIPDNEIRKTRGALFNYLVQKYANENKNNFRH